MLSSTRMSKTTGHACVCISCHLQKLLLEGPSVEASACMQIRVCHCEVALPLVALGAPPSLPKSHTLG